MSTFLTDATYARLKELLNKERKEAQAKGDAATTAEINKVQRLLESGGGILRRENPYLNFTRHCILHLEKKPETLGDIQRAMKNCAGEWSKLTDEEKKRFERKATYELYNLP